MKFKLISIPITDPEKTETELNAILGTKRISRFDYQLVNEEGKMYCCCCVTYAESDGGSSSSHGSNRGSDIPKPDYKEILKETYPIFEMLKKCRRQIADEDKVAPYIVCTDAQLAEIVKQGEVSEEVLKRIGGFGEKKLETYGKRLLRKWEEAKNEALRQSDGENR